MSNKKEIGFFKKIRFLQMVCVFFFILLPLSAFADQAAWISKADAEKAVRLIHPGTELRKYCAPCGDATWISVTANQVEVKHQDAQFDQVVVNGQGIDLAYVYIEKNGKWMNLAILLGLSVSDVPEILPQPQEPASKENVHPIDKILNECIAKDSSTAGMTNCIHMAYELWDAELNKVYNSLRVLLKTNQQKNALKAAQLEWIKYRDLEFELIESIYSSLDGTMYILMRSADRTEIVKKRVMELGAYLDLLKEN